MRQRLFSVGLPLLIAAVGAVALWNASFLWQQVAATFALALLLFALVAAAFQSGRRRAFWGGFAVFGWSYLLLAVTPWFGDLKAQLLTSRAATALRQAVLDDSADGAEDLLAYATTPRPQGRRDQLTITVDQSASAQGQRIVSLRGRAPTFAARPTAATSTSGQYFENICHTLWLLLLALGGGLLGRFCCTPPAPSCAAERDHATKIG